jgi:polyphosphate glucokinase
MSERVLVVDVGGTAVKLTLDGEPPRRFMSGRWLTPSRLVTRVHQHVKEWEYDVISLGYPGKVVGGKPAHEPWNLADGWLEFDY